MKKIYRHIIITSVITLSLNPGCRGKNLDTNNSHSPANSEDLELTLPAVPENLTQPEERAAFVALHFWDALDFKDDSRSRDTAFMEQNFANFISLLPYAPEEKAQEAVGRLLDSAAADTHAADLLRYVSERYLDDPNSPMRSEDIYILFLRHISGSDLTEEADKERAAHRLYQAMKNRPGTQASDFRLITRNGVTTRLLESVRQDTTLVMFYDPDCTQCKEFTPKLQQSPLNWRFRILAIDVATDRNLWDATKREMPRGWEVAFALDPVDEDELYYLPALPSLYLISPAGEVILKDIPFSTLP